MKNPIRKIRKLKKNIKNLKRPQKINGDKNKQSKKTEVLKKIVKEKNQQIYKREIEKEKDEEILLKNNIKEKTYKMVIEDDEEEAVEEEKKEQSESEENKVESKKVKENKVESKTVEENKVEPKKVEQNKDEPEKETLLQNNIEEKIYKMVIEDDEEESEEEEEKIEEENKEESEKEESGVEEESEEEDENNEIEEEESVEEENEEESETSGAETIKDETESEEEEHELPIQVITNKTLKKPKNLTELKNKKNQKTLKQTKPKISEYFLKKQKLKALKKKIKRTICIPDSILEKVQTVELQNHLIGQLARTLCMYKINEVIILKDHSYKKKFYDLNPSEYMIKILQYLETPQYLRKRLFPISNTLRHVGLIMPLECCHHLQLNDIFKYREGVVLRRPFKDNKGSWVDIGLKKDCKIKTHIQPNVRVTIKIEDFDKELNKKFYSGEVVAPKEVQKETGFFWGYNVEAAYTFSEIFKNLDKNCLKILIDPESDKRFGDDLKEEIENEILDKESEEVFIFFCGEGLKYLYDCDEVTKIQYTSLENKFDFRFNPYYDTFGFNNIYVDEQVAFYSNEIFN